MTLVSEVMCLQCGIIESVRTVTPTTVSLIAEPDNQATYM